MSAFFVPFVFCFVPLVFRSRFVSIILHNPSIPQHDAPFGMRGEEFVMGYEQQRRAFFLIKPNQEFQNVAAISGV